MGRTIAPGGEDEQLIQDFKSFASASPAKARQFMRPFNVTSWFKHRLVYVYAYVLGYDSIQVRSYDDPWLSKQHPQVVVTASKCMLHLNGMGSCPPLPMKRGLDASLPCTCDDRSFSLSCM